MIFKMKLFLLLLLFLLMYLYLPLNRRKAKYYWRSQFEDFIPYLSWFVIPYIFYYFWVGGSILLLWDSPIIETYLTSFILLVSFSVLFWYMFPNGVVRPKKLQEKSSLEKATKWFYVHDGETNGLPSAHVSYTLLATYYFLFQVYPEQWWMLVVATLISLSTLFVKQHYIVDVLASPLFVTSAIYITPIVIEMLAI